MTSVDPPRHLVREAVARALAEERETPPGVDDPEIYRTRPAQTVLPEQADWVEATEAVRAPA